MPNRKSNALPIACNLGERKVVRRKDSTTEVLRQALQVREIEDGYEFTFSGKDRLVPSIVEIVTSERKCCPFFTFGLLFEAAGGPIRLRVTGPEGAKEFIQEELSLTPHNG